MNELTLTKTKTKEKSPDFYAIEHCRVILFDDDWHTLEDVMHQLILAVNCTSKRAEEMTWTVHTEGKCEVFCGPMEDCLEVSAALEDIDLRTEIRF
jgi:ATP-dependent Clp protease adaptor protein ClpS